MLGQVTTLGSVVPDGIWEFLKEIWEFRKDNQAVLELIAAVIGGIGTVWAVVHFLQERRESFFAARKEAEKCLILLREIQDANDRIIGLGRSGTGPWAEILGDTYTHVCEMHQGKVPRDAYFNAICGEPDIDTVCAKKWDLGDTLKHYHKRLVSSQPRFYHDLDKKIQSVTLRNCSPEALQMAVREAIEAAELVVNRRRKCAAIFQRRA